MILPRLAKFVLDKQPCVLLLLLLLGWLGQLIVWHEGAFGGGKISFRLVWLDRLDGHSNRLTLFGGHCRSFLRVCTGVVESSGAKDTISHGRYSNCRLGPGLCLSAMRRLSFDLSELNGGVTPRQNNILMVCFWFGCGIPCHKYHFMMIDSWMTPLLKRI